MNAYQFDFNHRKFSSHNSSVWAVSLFLILSVTIVITIALNLTILSTICYITIAALLVALIYVLSIHRREKTVLTIRQSDDGVIVSYFYKNDPDNEYGNEIEYFRVKDFCDYEIYKNKLYLYGDITLYSPKNGIISERKMSRIAIYDYFNLNENFFEILRNN
jgi:hypothetical protein